MSAFNGKSYNQAITDYTEALRHDPECALVYANRAAAYFNTGRDSELSLDDCNRALAIDPRQALAYANRGGVYLNRNDPVQALNDSTRAIELDPTLPWPLPIAVGPTCRWEMSNTPSPIATRR